MANLMQETTEFDTNIFGEGFNRPDMSRMVSTRVVNNYSDASDNEYLLRSHDSSFFL